MVKHITALRVLLSLPQPCHSCSLLAFCHFLPFCPTCYSPASPPALRCTVWSVASLLPVADGVGKSPQPLNAGCHLLVSCFGQQAALSLQPCRTCSADDIIFHGFAGALRALCSMSPSILSQHVRTSFTVFYLGTSPGPEPRRLNSKLFLGLM